MDKPEISIRRLAEIYTQAGQEIFGYTGQARFAVSEDKEYLQNNPNRRCPAIDRARNLLGYEPKPDVGQAAGYMRRLYEDEEYRAGLAQRAGVYIRQRLSAERIAQLLSVRLTEIKGELECGGYVIPDADEPLL